MKKFILLITLISFTACKSQIDKKMAHEFTNDLIQETSPYLLQHAHNPVNWKAWNEKTLEQAKKENKLIIVSIGYSSCHWCHVMEHESFQDSTVAAVMNKHFISIKVDREERPDVDQVYMNAVQLMTGRGGWPLNCITLPDGRPIWGGTYFPKENWINALEQLSKMFNEQPDRMYEQADKLIEGIKSTNLIEVKTGEADFSKEALKTIVDQWQSRLDFKWGGNNRSPKFPMPNNYQFLLRYATQTQDQNLLDFVNTTLSKMALGGIYDHIGGGFARYSTDKKWHIPHFEKMLYDNGQLVSLYADAYLATKNPLYKQTVYQTLDFVERELTTEEGAFFSSLDADSKTDDGHLEEGAYYVWTKAELTELLKKDFQLFSAYYNINDFGKWEKENYVLIRKDSDSKFAEENGLTVGELEQKVSEWRTLLLKVRNIRDRPRLDNKTLTSWNALMLKGYADAYRVFNDPHFLEVAEKNALFIQKNQLQDDFRLNHNYKEGKSTINGYLEDYATVIDAYIALYESSLNEKWLQTAKQITDYTFDHFYDDKTKMFYFTSDLDSDLITRKIEIEDNVIPASNSIMARNLFKLSHYYSNRHYLKTSRQLLHNITDRINQYGSGYSNWLQLMSDFVGDYYEVAISGKDAVSKLKEINSQYIPNKLIAGSSKNSTLPLMEGRYSESETLIYICVDGACQLPVTESKKAMNQMNIHF